MMVNVLDPVWSMGDFESRPAFSLFPEKDRENDRGANGKALVGDGF